MLSARRESAIEYGQRAVELATVLDLPEVRAHALNNMGAAQQGKPEAIPLLEESVELSSRLNSPEEARGHHNLGVCWYMLGDVRKALAELEAAVSSGERFGLAPLVRFSRTQVPGYYFRVGRWDDAIELANAVIAVGGRDESTSIARAWVRTLRGDLEEAVEDVERALEAARRAGDPQSMYPCLGVTAFVQAEAGNRERARALLTELADQWSQTEVAYGAPADMGIAWLDILGPESWRACYDRDDSEPTVWREGVRALVDEDYARAIEVYESTGAVTDVAAAQLYAARKLVESGRRAEADLYLQPALSFYRSVRATPRVRQGEALLAATA
jgi:tetratricopeptide (TPR) repeat protein